MKFFKKYGSFTVVVLAIFIVIGGIIAGGIAFGNKANNLQNNSIPSSATQLTTEDISITEETYPETEAVFYEYTEGYPPLLCEFAQDNNLSLSEWPDEVVELMEKYPQTEEFVLNYPLLKDKTFEIDISDSGYQYEVPLFIQWDERWGYSPYGYDMIANAGCGPVCLSMVSAYLLQDPTLDPKTVAEFSMDNGYCAPGDGSYWSLIYDGGEQLGLNVEEIPLVEQYIIDNLIDGNPIICNVSQGDFTYGGHFIVLADYVDGKIKINDPNSIENSEKLWTYEEICDQIEALWVCSVY